MYSEAKIIQSPKFRIGILLRNYEHNLIFNVSPGLVPIDCGVVCSASTGLMAICDDRTLWITMKIFEYTFRRKNWNKSFNIENLVKEDISCQETDVDWTLLLKLSQIKSFVWRLRLVIMIITLYCTVEQMFYSYSLYICSTDCFIPKEWIRKLAGLVNRNWNLREGRDKHSVWWHSGQTLVTHKHHQEKL